jgi:hypothetical protein
MREGRENLQRGKWANHKCSNVQIANVQIANAQITRVAPSFADFHHLPISLIC